MPQISPINAKEVYDAPRKRINIALSVPVVEKIEELKKGLVLELEGGKEKPYPRSYMIEDLLLYVLTDEKRLNQFLRIEYGEELP